MVVRLKLKNLIKRRWKSDDEDEDDDSRCCEICQEPVNVEKEDGTVEIWSALPCGHRFGILCIREWLCTAIEPSCPSCRRNLAMETCKHPFLPTAAKVIRTQQTGTAYTTHFDKQCQKSLEGRCGFCRSDAIKVYEAAESALYGLYHNASSIIPAADRLTALDYARRLKELMVARDNDWKKWWDAQTDLPEHKRKHRRALSWPRKRTT